MKIINKVQGSEEASKPLIVNVDTVYVHSNIKKVPYEELKKQFSHLTDEEINKIDLYEYDEIQYTKDEYIYLIGEENEHLKNNITDLELAITELYEGGLN